MGEANLLLELLLSYGGGRGVWWCGTQLRQRLDASSARLESKMDAYHEQLSTQVQSVQATLLHKLDSLLGSQRHERPPVPGGGAGGYGAGGWAPGGSASYHRENMATEMADTEDEALLSHLGPQGYAPTLGPTLDAALGRPRASTRARPGARLACRSLGLDLLDLLDLRCTPPPPPPAAGSGLGV